MRATATLFVLVMFLWVNYVNQQPVSTFVHFRGRLVVSIGIEHPLLARVLGDLNLGLGLAL